VWASDGFLFNLGARGAIDFAGGTVVHISAGVAGLVAALYLGPRRGYPATAMHPNNLVMTLMGAGLLWVGWFGFNAGSAIASDLQTAQALTATQIAAAAGALSWMLIEAAHHGRATSLGVASGVLAGLVVITPAAGVVQPKGALMLGALASAVSYGAIMLKNRMRYDDTLDVFGIHGVAGIAGAIALTFFVRDSWMAEAATAAGGSWTMLDQLWVQLAGVGVTIVYAGICTLAILFVVDKLVGLRMAEKAEMAGMDHAEHGEDGYGMLNAG
ncbi:MAG: ammonia channel protein, partial [Nannocystaceae bacterium]